MPSHYQGSEEEVLALTTYIKLLRAAESVGSQLLQSGTFGCLTPSQFAVMEALYHLGTLRLGEVSTKLLKSNSNITLVIDNLEKQGWVRRQRDQDDRRTVHVSLTETGKALIQSLLPEHVTAIREMMKVLTPEEQATLGEICRRLGKASASQSIK